MINLTKTVHSELREYDIKIKKIHSEVEYTNFSTYLIKGHAENLLKYGDIDDKEKSFRQAEYSYKRVLPDGLKTKGHHLSTIELDKIPIGYIWYHFNDDKSAKLNYLCIFNQYRGQGHSKKAMIYLEKVLKKQNIEHIKLKVFSMNTVARNLYNSLGYMISEKLTPYDYIYTKKI